jgi:hypothetical protein
MSVSINNLKVNNVSAADDVRVTDRTPVVSWEFEGETVATVGYPPPEVQSEESQPQGAFEVRLGTSTLNHGTVAFVGDVDSTGWVESPQNWWTVNGRAFQRGHTYFGQVRVQDQYDNASDWETFSFTFNTPPAADSVAISPAAPEVGGTLEVVYDYSDADGDEESGSRVRWFRNGVHQRQLDGYTQIPAEYIAADDTWVVDVQPNDGYEFGDVYSSLAVIVSPAAGVDSIQNAKVLPESPSPYDPLYAYFDFAGDETVYVRWYVNDSRVAEADDARLYRFDLSVGDRVYFQATRDSSDSARGGETSEEVVVVAATSYVYNMRVNGEVEPLEVSTSTPLLTWDVISPAGVVAAYAQIRIGTAPDAADVLATSFDLSDNRYTVPSSLLGVGSDYYISVAVGADAGTLGPREHAHFRTTGSLWEKTADNTTGWTVETVVKVVNSESGYQGIRLSDGSRYLEVRFAAASISAVTTALTSAVVDLARWSVVTVVGQGDEAKIYVNNTLALTVDLDQPGPDRYLEFGAISDSVSSAQYKSIKYTTGGAFYPDTSAEYGEFVFTTLLDLPEREITAIGGDGASSVVATQTTDETAEVLKYDPQRQVTVHSAVSRSYSPVNKINASPDGKYLFFSHANGATWFKSRPIFAYDETLDLTAERPTDKNWTKTTTKDFDDTPSEDGLVIDTRGGGKWFYALDSHGSEWFDRVDNARGWVVDFTATVTAIADDSNADLTATPEGFGVYVNDGTYYETLNLFASNVALGTSGTVAEYDATVKSDYRIVGQGNGIQVWAKPSSENSYTKILDEMLTFRGSPEGNGRRPSLCTDSEGVLHAVWQDDGKEEGRQILYAKYDNGLWTTPAVIATANWNAVSPQISSIGTRLFVAFEAWGDGYTSLAMVVKNEYGWSSPLPLLNSGAEVKNPRLAADGSDLWLVWEDYGRLHPAIYAMKRDASTGVWSSPVQLNDTGRPCTNPSADASGGYLLVSWTQKVTDSNTAIYLKAHGPAGWTAARMVTDEDSAVRPDFSDLVVQNTTVHVVWHDCPSEGVEQIFSRRFNRSVVALTSVEQLSEGTVPSQFPSIGHASTPDKVVCVYQRSNDTGDASLLAADSLSSAIYAAVFSGSAWDSTDVLLNPEDNRYSRWPKVAKRYDGSDAHVSYEAEIVLPHEGYVSSPFVAVRDAVYDLSTSTPYLLVNDSANQLDLVISAQLPRKEIRFGDFSDAYKGRCVFNRVSAYVGAAVEPFEIGLVSAGTQPITDDRAYDAVVNNYGDAWLGTHGGLLFYFRESNRVALLPDSGVGGTPVVATALDRNGRLFVATATDSGTVPDGVADIGVLLHSPNHVDFYVVSATGLAHPPIRCLAFDTDDRLWLGTTNGAYCLQVETAIAEQSDEEANLTVTLTKQLRDELPSSSVHCIAADPEGGVWIGTNRGLAKYKDGVVTTYTATNSSLLSNRINGIACRSGGVRYVATSAGLCEMEGDTFRRFASTEGTPWNNNVRAVLWQEPNILWVTTLSDIILVEVDDETGGHESLTFGIANYALNATAYNDLRTYYVQTVPISPSQEADPDADAVVEVYVNGRRVPFGYTVSTDRKVVAFETPLLASDLVYVRYRNDFSLHATMRQNAAEIADVGRMASRIERLQLVGTDIYAVASFGETRGLYKYLEAGSTLPYVDVVLDTTPPTGTLSLVKQTGRYTLQLAVAEAQDALSGLAQMVVSNFPNFTTDGETPQTPIDYSDTVTHTLDSSVDNLSTSHTFASGEGKGNRIVKHRVDENDETYYCGTKGPACVLRYDSTTSTWEKVVTLDAASTASVDSMVSFASKLYVFVGKEAGTSKVYVTSNGRDYTLLASIGTPHLYAASVFSGLLWFGGTDGKVYAYDGANPVSAARYDTGQDVIWAIQGLRNSLYVATGTTGNVVQILLDAGSQQIVYTGGDPNVTALDVLIVGTKFYLYIGTGSTGEVLSRETTSGVFTTSFNAVPDTVQRIKIDDAALRFALGSQIYVATIDPDTSTFSGWSPLPDFSQDVKDFVPAATTGDQEEIPVMVVTEDKIVAFTPSTDTKKVYLRLIDNAGNESADGQIFTEIDLTDLTGFANANRLLTLEPSGQQVDFIDGENPFYSGTRISEETGEYLSEIFFGTNNLISWDLLTWQADTPDGTDVTLYLRAADSRDDVADADWQLSFASNFQSGVNISTLQGRYIQFKAVLSTERAGVSPTLTRVVIRSKNSESTHFFTTNFALGAKIRRGLLTCQTVVPVAADVVFGFDTHNSTNFPDYQVITPNRIFTAGGSQSGSTLRVGVKFLTPTPGTFATDTFGEYGPYDEPLYLNTVDFVHSRASTFHYRVTFFKDFALSETEYVAFSSTSQDGWTADGAAVDEDGVSITAGGSKIVAFTPPGDSTLVCNTYYFVRVESFDTESEAYRTITEGYTFISACNTSFVDDISFEYAAASAATYHFRVRMYDEPERTTLLKTYYSGVDASPWSTTEQGAFPSVGLSLTTGETVTVLLHPPPSDMEANKVYYLIIDAYDGAEFGVSSTNLTFRVSDPVADEYCGPYRNVPIMRNFALMFELENGEQVTLNL